MRYSLLLHRGVDVARQLVPVRFRHALYSVSPRAVRAFHKVIKNFTKDEIIEDVIQHGHLKGRRFRCSLKHERGYWLGKWEQDVQDYMVGVLRHGMVVFDIGAHKGFFSLLAAQSVGETGRVISFEPAADTRRMAIENFDLNPDLKARITVSEYALSDVLGTAKFRTVRPGATRASIWREGDTKEGDTVEVRCTTLDAFVASEPAVPDFIKMDIQGGEKYALEGMRKTLRAHGPLLLMEIHDQPSWDKFCQILEECDYVAQRVSEPVPPEELDWTEKTQYVAVPSAIAGVLPRSESERRC